MSRRTGSDGHTRALLWTSVPIAGLAMVAGLAGFLSDATYAAETPNWAAQAVGQDAVNVLLAYPALLVLAWLAAKGSLGAYLAWLGVLAYSAYSYLLYAGFLHFSGWFLVHVTVLGLSVFVLIGGLLTLAGAQVRAAFTPRAPTRLAGRALVVFGVLFALMWLAEIVPAAVSGEPLPSAQTAGLVTNPVHLLDLAIFLPGMVLTGVLLLRGRILGYTLVIPFYVWGAVMGTAVVGMFVSLAASGEPFELVPVAIMVAATVIKLVIAVRLLASLDPGASVTGSRAPELVAIGPDTPTVT